MLSILHETSPLSSEVLIHSHSACRDGFKPPQRPVFGFPDLESKFCIDSRPMFLLLLDENGAFYLENVKNENIIQENCELRLTF